MKKLMKHEKREIAVRSKSNLKKFLELFEYENWFGT